MPGGGHPIADQGAGVHELLADAGCGTAKGDILDLDCLLGGKQAVGDKSVWGKQNQPFSLAIEFEIRVQGTAEVPATCELDGVIVRIRTSEYSGLVCQVPLVPLKLWPSGVRAQSCMGLGLSCVHALPQAVLISLRALGSSVFDSTSSS